MGQRLLPIGLFWADLKHACSRTDVRENMCWSKNEPALSQESDELMLAYESLDKI